MVECVLGSGEGRDEALTGGGGMRVVVVDGWWWWWCHAVAQELTW